MYAAQFTDMIQHFSDSFANNILKTFDEESIAHRYLATGIVYDPWAYDNFSIWSSV